MPQKLNKEGTKWRIQVRAGEQRPSEIVHGDKREADQREAELKAKYGRMKLKKAHGETVAEYLHRWLAGVSTEVIDTSTRERYDTNIRRQLGPIVGSIELTKLDSAAVISGYDALASGALGRRYDLATIRKAHNVLKAALEDAVEDQAIPSNPAASRRVSKWFKSMGRKRRKRSMTPPALKDVQAALGKLLTTDSGRLLYGPCLLALDTGLRRGELLGLKWSDIKFSEAGEDLPMAVAEVQRSVAHTRHTVEVKDTKTENSDRTVLLTRRATEYLRRLRADQDEARRLLPDEWVDEDWVFPAVTVWRSEKRGRVWKPNAFSALLERENVRQGFHLEVHALRRLHATIMEHAEVPQTEIAARLGHGSTDVTRGHYLFVVEDGQRQAVDAFEAAVGA